MEVSIFPAPAVRAQKSQFIEARLHADTKDLVLRARIAELVESMAKSTAQPIYVALDAKEEVELGRFSGAILSSPDPFASFLSEMLDGSH